MTESVFRCAQCGQPLPTANSVCSRCDAELAPKPDIVPPGKYECPACHLKFNKAEPVLSPADGKWYKPQVWKVCCPHCKHPLVSKYYTKSVRSLIWLYVIILLLKTFFGLPNQAISIVYGVFIICIFMILIVTAYRDYRDPNRFIADTSRDRL